MVSLSERAKSGIVFGIISGFVIVALGTMGYQLNTHVKKRENEHKAIFNDWKNLEHRTIQEGDRCVNYAKELKKEYPQRFEDWSSLYLAYKIEDITENPNCKKLIPGKTIQIPRYSNP